MTFLTTPRGLRYPDRNHPADVSAIVKALADDTDAQLAGLALPADWTAYAPAVSGLPVKASLARYMLVADTVHFRCDIVANGAATGAISIALPMAAATIWAPIALLAQVAAKDVSSGQYWSGLLLAQDITAAPTRGVVFLSSSATGVPLTNTGTAPFAWAVDDVLSIVGTYERS